MRNCIDGLSGKLGIMLSVQCFLSYFRLIGESVLIWVEVYNWMIAWRGRWSELPIIGKVYISGLSKDPVMRNPSIGFYW